MSRDKWLGSRVICLRAGAHMMSGMRPRSQVRDVLLYLHSISCHWGVLTDCSDIDEREKERERERERARQTETDRERKTERKGEREESDKKRERERERERERKKEREINVKEC